jgi:hypothetical protein
MSVTAFQDVPMADRDREWDGAAAERRVRSWAGAEDEPNEKYRDLPSGDVDRVKSHLAKYYAKMDDTAPWER